MDALKAVIADKRKVIEDETVTPRPTKYVRRGEMERLREEQAAKNSLKNAVQVNGNVNGNGSATEPTPVSSNTKAAMYYSCSLIA